MDVIIIGGGISGWSTAYYIKKHRPDIVVKVLDHSRFPTVAATWRSAGSLACGSADHPTSGSDWHCHRLKAMSFLLHHQLAKDLKGEQSYGYRPLQIFHADASLPAGKDSPPWPQQRFCPPDDRKYESHAAQVNPRHLLQTLQKACFQMGVVFQECLAERIVWGHDRIESIVLSNGQNLMRRGDRKFEVVMCSGPWASQHDKWCRDESRGLFSGMELSAVRWTSYHMEARKAELAAKAYYVEGFQHRKNHLRAIGNSQIEIVCQRDTVMVTSGNHEFLHTLDRSELSRDPSRQVAAPPPKTALLLDACFDASVGLGPGNPIASFTKNHEVQTRVKAMMRENELSSAICYTKDLCPVIGQLPASPGLWLNIGHWQGILTGVGGGYMIAKMLVDKCENQSISEVVTIDVDNVKLPFCKLPEATLVTEHFSAIRFAYGYNDMPPPKRVKLQDQETFHQRELREHLISRLPTDIGAFKCPSCKLDVCRLYPAHCLGLGVCVRCQYTNFDCKGKEDRCDSCFDAWPDGKLTSERILDLRMRQLQSLEDPRSSARLSPMQNLPEWCEVDRGAQVWDDAVWEDCTILEFYNDTVYVQIDDGENLETTLDCLRDSETHELAKAREKQTILADITRGIEEHPMPVVVPGGRIGVSPPSTKVLHDLKKYQYINESILNEDLFDKLPLLNMVGKCFGCSGQKCQLQTVNLRTPNFGNGEKCSHGAYTGDRLVVPLLSLMECNFLCRCDARYCKNRVLQRGCKKELNVDWRNGSWALSCRSRLRQGEFICEFTGVIDMAKKVPSQTIIHLPGADHWVSAVNQNPLQAIGNTNTQMAKQQQDAIEKVVTRCQAVLMVDAKHYGNIGKFVQVSDDPKKQNVNLVWVWVDSHDPLLPRIGFYANRDIKAGETLARAPQDSRVDFED